MGCTLTKTQDEHNIPDHSRLQLEEVYVFVPGIRIPRKTDFAKHLRDHVSGKIIARLSHLRSKVVAAAEDARKHKMNKASGEACIHALQKALEDYLPCLLGLVSEDGTLNSHTEFGWLNQEDEIKETTLSSAYYELLSIFHLVGVLFLLEANTSLRPRSVENGRRTQANEENKRVAVECLMKTAEVMDYAIKSVLPKIPDEIRRKLPADIVEGSLNALQLQALGQAVEIQLGLAMDNSKATLAVKRRLACEQVKYWKMAYENLDNIHFGIGWGEKHVLFLKWKRAAAKAGAYYFHGLVMDETRHNDAVTCLLASESFLRESQQFCTEFGTTPPVTKQPLVWGAMKLLSEKIPKEVAYKAGNQRAPNILPDLPDFPLSLKADEYELPEIDDIWNEPKN